MGVQGGEVTRKDTSHLSLHVATFISFLEFSSLHVVQLSLDFLQT
jgi:hypothetical protein